jgi:hypothetical protein
MIPQVDDYFVQGVLAPAFQAERNILIWQYIGDDSAFLKTQKKHIQDLYLFIQQSAQTNFVLHLGKLFDQPKGKYPTRCILSFLRLLKSSDINAGLIIETTSTKKIVVENNCPQELINAVESQDQNLFPFLFASHYLKKYSEPQLQEEIKILKSMRDKAEAHNEATLGRLSLEFSTTNKLLEFALEIISIFGMAYRSEGYKINGHSFIKTNAERSAAFIRACIDELRKNKKASS